MTTRPLPFFVYGTLLPGQPLFPLWRETITALRPAELPYARLFDLGYYPMVVDSLAGVVRGLVVELEPDSYTSIAAILDEAEGVAPGQFGAPFYQRRRRVARLSGGQSVVAWVYIGDPVLVVGLEPIGLDWIAYLRGAKA
jgi:gamma-glutamylcyclotransferase (GGCT)/AIG2-like uncharacterized protein YtfP